MKPAEAQRAGERSVGRLVGQLFGELLPGGECPLLMLLLMLLMLLNEEEALAASIHRKWQRYRDCSTLRSGVGIISSSRLKNPTGSDVNVDL